MKYVIGFVIFVAPAGDRRSKWEGRPPEAMFDDESGADA